MRPLDRVTRTARTVAAELGPDGSGLDRRVAEADPHTEVGQLAEAVNTMLDAVEREYSARYESEQRMRRFLADASHELRTPLTSLRGYAELVRLRGGLDETAGDSLRRIESEGTRMGRLVDDLLILARADRGTVVERAPVDLAVVVADCVAGLRAAHPDRPVSVRAGGPLPVLGDRDRLVQVVGNVLTNAAVHAGGAITVTASRQDGEIVVRVADGGPGLPPEQAAQVFDRFWRADSARTRVRGGSGLGLSIVQVLVAEHGGQVSFDSDPAAGTTVTLRLPAAPPP
jgi:two-component system, OmpR family, sensor kinase